MTKVLGALVGGMAMMAAATAITPAASASDTVAAVPFTGSVAVIVSFPMKAGMTRHDVEALFKKYTPFYEAQEGLKQKYFTIDEKTHRMGGIYLWANRTVAEHFYNDAWRHQVVTAFGAEPETVWYDVPSVIRGKAGMS